MSWQAISIRDVIVGGYTAGVGGGVLLLGGPDWAAFGFMVLTGVGVTGWWR